MVVELIQRYAPNPAPQDNSKFLSAMQSIAMILSARLLLLLGLVSCAVLAGLVIIDPSTLKLWGMGIYFSGVFIPLILLYFSKGGAA